MYCDVEKYFKLKNLNRLENKSSIKNRQDLLTSLSVVVRVPTVSFDWLMITEPSMLIYICLPFTGLGY